MGSFIFLELDLASPRRAETGCIKQGSQGAAIGGVRPRGAACFAAAGDRLIGRAASGRGGWFGEGVDAKKRRLGFLAAFTLSGDFK
jgi:hypothetical protein